MKDFIISPPFGRYFSHPKATSVKGSYTWERRNGLILQVLKTVRPTKDGWINKIGLRNSGIRSVSFKSENIYSIAGINDGDWDKMIDAIPDGNLVECNFSCPNVDHYTIDAEVIVKAAKKFTVIAKVPPVNGADKVIQMCVEAGAHHIHLTNALPVDRGGESGGKLKPVSLGLVKETRQQYPDLSIIGGGGIYSVDDVYSYRNAGANKFSLSTAFMVPWRGYRIINDFYKKT
jgi:dihydroorotate dehydrogenase